MTGFPGGGGGWFRPGRGGGPPPAPVDCEYEGGPGGGETLSAARAAVGGAGLLVRLFNEGVARPCVRCAGVGADEMLDSVGRRAWMSSKADSVMTPFSRRDSSSWWVLVDGRDDEKEARRLHS